MTKKYGWTKDVLINHIENKSYEKHLLNQTNFDETLPEKNPSIGIIICKNKNRTVVEYALNDSYKPIGVATYQIIDTLPEKMIMENEKMFLFI